MIKLNQNNAPAKAVRAETIAEIIADQILVFLELSIAKNYVLKLNQYLNNSLSINRG